MRRQNAGLSVWKLFIRATLVIWKIYSAYVSDVQSLIAKKYFATIFWAQDKNAW